MRWLSAWILLSSILHSFSCQAFNADFPEGEFIQFKTEPFKQNRIKILQSPQDKSVLQPGYIFIGPYPRKGAPFVGPQILDQEGHLIWQGNASTKGHAQNFHPCRYLGSELNHLCWCEADFRALQGARGWNRLFDDTYTQSGRDYRESGPLRFPNPHEFFVVPDGKSFLQSVYQLRRRDLVSYGGTVDGYIEDGCFQEVDIVTGDSLFAWCGADHLPLWHTTVFLDVPGGVNSTGEHYGDGTIRNPWDYFHLNSVDKTPDGDYIISARHLNQVMKIAGNDNPKYGRGRIIWRLGGRDNSFAGDELLDLSKQHHARIVSTDGNTTTLSIFNNQWRTRGNNGTRISNAQVFVLDEGTKEVLNVRKFYEPEGKISFAQGSVQVLANGNVFVGWGTVPHYSEFSADGELLSHVQLSPYNESGSINDNQQNYRTFKFPWSGNPRTVPKLLVYTRDCAGNAATAPLTAYVSWNGATAVRRWRFYTSWTSRGPWLPSESVDKEGFETKARLYGVLGRPLNYRRYVKVVALDEHDTVLASSAPTTPFVPPANMSRSCDKDGCADGGDWFAYEPSPATTCSASGTGLDSLFIAIVMVAMVVQILVVVHLIRCWVKGKPRPASWAYMGPPAYSKLSVYVTETPL